MRFWSGRFIWRSERPCRGGCYRSGGYVVDDAPQILFLMGIQGQNLFVDAAHKIVIAKLSSQAQPIDPRAIWLPHKAVAEFARCIGEGVPRGATVAG